MPCNTNPGKTISTAYKAHLAGNYQSRAVLYRITRRDDVVFGFTSCPIDIDGSQITSGGVATPETSGIIFKSKTGLLPSGLKSSLDLQEADNMEATAFFDDAGITDSDLHAGLFDDAEVLLMECNWRDLSMGMMLWKRGFVGKVNWTRAQFTAELRSFSTRLQQNIIPLTSLTCRVDQFGGKGCYKNLNTNSADGYAITKNGTVATVDSARPKRSFTSSDIASYPSNRFTYGRIKITNSASPNFGIWRKIRSNSGSALMLADPFPFPLQGGDTFTAICGCDRTSGMCGNTYNNIVWFQGEPNCPGVKIWESQN